MTAAVGIAGINSIGNLAGYVGPEMIGWLKAHYDFQAALNGVAVALAISGLLAIFGTRPAQAPRP